LLSLEKSELPDHTRLIRKLEAALNKVIGDKKSETPMRSRENTRDTRACAHDERNARRSHCYRSLGAVVCRPLADYC